MALVEDQQTNFKHFCRICKKGFMCGRALGGHMRAHGIGDESANIDDEDQGSDWEDRGNTQVNKRMYGLRTNPNRLKSCKGCENCGKEFVSWKSFLEHGKCISDDAGSISSSPRSSEDAEEQRRCQWSKRKRSSRDKLRSFTYPSSAEEDFAATCLVMLSNARVDPMSPDEAEESCASASKEDEPPILTNVASYVSPVSVFRPAYLEKAKGVAKGLFECKACKKVFNSHQALGGHRASHKKVKGCFAARLDITCDNPTNDEVNALDDFLLTPKSTSSSYNPSGSSKKKSKMHECTICHRIFLSGQALGGHKRCHWITSNSHETSSLPKFDQLKDQIDQIHNQMSKFIKSDTLDLNFPASRNNLAKTGRYPKNPLSFEVSTEINLQPLSVTNNNNEDNKIMENIYNDNNSNKEGKVIKDENIVIQDKDDEADSNVKLAKLTELKDTIARSGLCSWLQVGICSTTNVGSNT